MAGEGNGAEIMNVFLSMFNSLMQAGVVKTAYSSITKPSEPRLFGKVQVIGNADGGDKVIAAMEWLQRMSPDQMRAIDDNVQRIIAAGNLKKNFVCSRTKTIIFDGKWTEMAEVGKISQMLTRGSWFICDCQAKRKNLMLGEDC